MAAGDDNSTRERILQAAGALFAERGFDGATVRDICEAASANVASVNYHFRDKETLYAHAVERSIVMRTEQFPIDGKLGADAPAPERLRAFVSAFLKRRFDRTSPAWCGELLAREMRNPRECVRAMIDREKRATRQLLSAVVKDLVGARAKQDLIDRCAGSVLGLVFFYFHGHFSRRGRSRGEEIAPQRLEELASHIAEFALGGIARVAD